MEHPYVKVTDEDILSRIKEIYIREYDKESVFGRAMVEVYFEKGIIDIFYREDYSNLIFIKIGQSVDLYIKNEDAIYRDCAPYVIWRR